MKAKFLKLTSDRAIAVACGAVTAFAFAALGDSAWAYDLNERNPPKSFQSLTQDPANARPVELQPSKETGPDPGLEERFANYLRNDDCASILSTVSGHDYEVIKPELLAVLATCEPPGKDPEKMFAYAEERAPTSDTVLLLHARYRWTKHRAGAEELFERLAEQTQDPRLKNLAEQYIDVPAQMSARRRSLSFAVTGYVGGIQETNPEGLPISNSNFGLDLSTGAVGGIGVTGEKAFNSYLASLDYIANDTTYWLTHSVDLLTQDVDFPIERVINDESTIGVRPFGSFYMLNGARYYTVTGLGVIGKMNREVGSYWSQISVYHDTYYPSESAGQSGSHVRFDLSASFKSWTVLRPALYVYVDRGIEGADVSSSQFIPYSHTDYGVGASFNHVVHRYSIGLAFRGLFRDDMQNTRLIDSTGNSISKVRQDMQLVIQPNLTVPLGPGLELFLYFESNSVGSTLNATDGLDRNISDSTMGAIIRTAITSF